MEDLRAARERAGFARERAAALLGVRPETLGRWERGVQNPSVRNLRALEALYGAWDGRDESAMREALRLAGIAAREGEAPVGCCVVWGGCVVGRGYNRRERGKNALAHAELEAIDEACRTLGGWRLWDAALYVTLEPCPMCAGAIINARVRRVVYGASDPKAGSCGSVCDLFALSYNHRPAVEGGLLADESAALLRGFFRALRGKK